MIVSWNLIELNVKDEYPDLQPYAVSSDLVMYFFKKVMLSLVSKPDLAISWRPKGQNILRWKAN